MPDETNKEAITREGTERRANSAEIARDIREIKNRLYGENHDKGDIPSIIEHLEKLNGTVAENCKDITVLQTNITSQAKWLSGITGGLIAVVMGLIGLFIQHVMSK